MLQQPELTETIPKNVCSCIFRCFDFKNIMGLGREGGKWHLKKFLSSLLAKKALFLRKETLENRVKRTFLGNIEDGSMLFAQVTDS